jgi:signal transduction histidine kinase/ActR/RegA family two-component response regulator
MEEKQSILIVDDDESARRSLRLIFEKMGYDTETAATGREAIEKAQVRFFNTALLDIKLPDVEGIELLAPLKKIHPDMVVIMITGYASLETAVRALNEGASAYIIKPLDMDEVLAIVRDVLEKQHLVTENRRLYQQAQRELAERKKAEKALRELLTKIERAKQEWESTADSLPEFICLVDHRGHISRANRTVETWNLARVVDVKGLGVHELLHPDCAGSSCYFDSFWKGAWKEAMGGEPAQCEAYDQALQRHVLIQVQPWKDWGKGTALGSTVVVVRDITERKRMEEELERAYRDLRDSQAKLIQAEKLAATGRLAASVAHEINNPLQGISNYLAVISRQMPGDHPLREDLDMVKLGFERISEIVYRLRAFYRPAEKEMEPTDINGVVKRVLALLGHQLYLGKVEVKRELPEQQLLVLGSAGQLEQVLVNLVVNAQEAMPGGGELMVRTALRENVVQLQVTDTGRGMSEEEMSRLFEPFYDGIGSKGLGLGLWISHNIIEAHGGHIEVESKVGQGTTFTISLPAYRGER